MVSLTPKLVPIEFGPKAPDNAVAPLIGPGTVAWLLVTLPVAVPVVLKKSLPACIAEAATSDVLANVPIAVFNAALRLAAVAVVSTPMVKLPAGGGVALEAVSAIDSCEPSGRLNVKLTLSPTFGLVAPRSIVTPAGEPPGPVTVPPPVREDETELSLRPNGEPAKSSATSTDVPVGELMTRRPRPLVPTSACL